MFAVADLFGFTKITTTTGKSGIAKHMTLKEFVTNHPVGKFYVHKRGHAFAVIDGVIQDWKYNNVGDRTRITLAYAA